MIIKRDRSSVETMKYNNKRKISYPASVPSSVMKRFVYLKSDN